MSRVYSGVGVERLDTYELLDRWDSGSAIEMDREADAIRILTFCMRPDATRARHQRLFRASYGRTTADYYTITAHYVEERNEAHPLLSAVMLSSPECRVKQLSSRACVLVSAPGDDTESCNKARDT
jgi:hypothetical protein